MSDQAIVQDEVTAPIGNGNAASDRTPSRLRRLPVVKLSLNVTPEDIATIEWLASEEQTTKTDAIRRALMTERYIREAMKQGAKILIDPGSGQPIERLIFR